MCTGEIKNSTSLTCWTRKLFVGIFSSHLITSPNTSSFKCMPTIFVYPDLISLKAWPIAPILMREGNFSIELFTIWPPSKLSPAPTMILSNSMTLSPKIFRNTSQPGKLTKARPTITKMIPFSICFCFSMKEIRFWDNAKSETWATKILYQSKISISFDFP